MAILNDYQCTGCDSMQERWTGSPPPSTLACTSCGADSRRLWAPIGLSGSAQATTSPSAPKPSLCTQYPQVPGLCHMSESAGRMWVAKYQGDNRAVESELSRQETRAREKAPTLDDAITHNHFPASEKKRAVHSDA